MTKQNVKYPCQGCVYFKVCGHSGRREPCAGRQTKTEQKRQQTARQLYHLMQAARLYA